MAGRAGKPGKAAGRGALQKNDNFFKAASNLSGDEGKVRRAFQRCAENGVLNLSGQNLTGCLPAGICGFQEASWSENWWEQCPVTKVDVSHNAIEQIPPEVSNLGECLAFIALGNQLASLPDELFAALPLKQLNLRQNRLASLPGGAALAQADQLVELVLGENQLQTLPAQIVGLPCLEVLDISANRLTALPDLPDAWRRARLKRLDVSKNCIGPSLPAGLRRCGALRELGASGNALEDVRDLFVVSPDESHGWGRSLVLLDLSANKLGPRFALGGLEAIDTLNAASNAIVSLELSGPFPCLTVVILDSNKIKELPHALLRSSAPRLTTLDFANNSLTALPPELGLSEALKRVAFVGNPVRTVRLELLQGSAEALKAFLKTRIEGAAGEEAVAAAEGARYDLAVELRTAAASHELCLEDRGLSQAPSLPEGLRKLCMPGNALAANALLFSLHLAGSSPATADAFPLRTLAAPRNSLGQGSSAAELLPRLLCGLPYLEELDLSGNRLSCTGSESAWASAWRWRGEPPGQLLAWLDLSNNALTAFPCSLLGACPALREFRARQNRITSLACTSVLQRETAGAALRTLDLERNVIAELPAWLPAVFPALQTMLLADNELGPSLSPELGFWESLQAVSLGGNPLRAIRQPVLAKGWGAVAAYLRDRLPTGAPHMVAPPDSVSHQPSSVASSVSSSTPTSGRHQEVAAAAPRSDHAAGKAAAATPVAAAVSVGADGELMERLRNEVAALEGDLAAPGLSRSRQSALSHSLRMKRAELLRADRERKRAAAVAEALVES